MCRAEHCLGITSLKSGRVAGKYLQNGKPRGDVFLQNTTPVEFHKAINLPLTDVYDILGISDTGHRTPYQDLRPAIKVVPGTKIRTQVKPNQAPTVTVYLNEE